ncbi:hypothetical protein ABZ806_37290 [Spirillospora sp. NPDC047418]
MSNLIYLWIAVCVVAGAALALIVPGLDLGFGIAIGTAIGIAGGAGHISHERSAGRFPDRAGERGAP